MKDVLLSVALERYCESVSRLKKGYNQEKYRILQISRSFLGSKIIHQISSVNIAAYRDKRLTDIGRHTQKLISPASVRLELSLLSHFFEIARIEWGLCNANPVTLVRKPKTPPGRDRRLAFREEKRLLQYCQQHSNQELFSIVILALETAMRQGEILSLHWENINFRTRVAHLLETKNGTKRDVPLSLKAREALMRLGVKHQGRVFNYTSNGFKSCWRAAILKLGFEDLHFHDLRHEAISRLFELGSLDVMEVAAISGHKSLAMLKRYTHLKAHLLVSKLEGNKNKSQKMMQKHLIPYPALVLNEEKGITVRLLDFEGLSGVGKTLEQALKKAQDLLLRQIITGLYQASPVPSPDQYIAPVDEGKIIMLDPLFSYVGHVEA